MLIGTQFNQNLYTTQIVDVHGQVFPGTNVPASSLPDLQRKLVSLRPQFVRLFFDAQQAGAKPGTQDSFVQTAQLAQSVGATINITLASIAPYIDDDETGMKAFAAVLKDLAVTHHVTNVRWVTLQNEPNTPLKDGAPPSRINPPRVNEMYRQLDKALTTNGLRPQIRFMGGDLLEGALPVPANPVLPQSFNAPTSDWNAYTDEAYWLTWMKEHMSDILDAYSMHIYWDVVEEMPPHPIKFQARLQSMAGAGKPIYVTEYGVRGKRPEEEDGPGTFTDGKPLETLNVTAFQHAWFQIEAARLKCAGTIKWDCFYGIYDRDPQSYYVLNAPENNIWAAYPTYHLLWLFMNTTEPTWLTSSVAGVEPEWAALAEFRGPATELTVIGLDTRWATRNDNSEVPSTYEIPTGLVEGTQLSLVVWNHNGGGALTHQPVIKVSAHGIATVDVPQHAVFALTNKALPPLPAV